MGTVDNSFIEQGWDPAAFGRRMDRRYQIIDRESGQWRHFGDLFRSSAAQQRYLKTVLREMRRGGPVRVIVLKGRKAGISTITGCLYYDIVTHRAGTDAGVLAHNKASTDILFRMTRNFWMRTDPAFRPQRSSSNTGRMEFGSKYVDEIEAGDIGLGSSYECQTAGADYPFTAGSMRLMHVSEVGKLPGDNTRQQETIISLTNAVPSNGPSIITFEGTAQGYGNVFHKMWEQAEENVRNGRKPEPGELIPVFVPWHDDRLNTMDVTPDFRWDQWDTEDIAREKDLLKRVWNGEFDKAARFLRWRRFKIAENGSDISKFQEEYPSTPEEAFLRGGKPAVPPHMLDYLVPLAGEPTGSYGWRLEDADEAIGPKAVIWSGG